ncbi:MAG: hypothetical protein P8R02_10450 [Pseudomonadales bacterium]|nr:hypothetical protein [Pseudomonadales bacterium]
MQAIAINLFFNLSFNLSFNLFFNYIYLAGGASQLFGQGSSNCRSKRTSMLAHRTDKKQRKKERRDKRNSEKAPSAVHFARTNLWELQNANILSSLFYDSGPN